MSEVLLQRNEGKCCCGKGGGTLQIHGQSCLTMTRVLLNSRRKDRLRACIESNKEEDESYSTHSITQRVLKKQLPHQNRRLTIVKQMVPCLVDDFVGGFGFRQPLTYYFV